MISAQALAQMQRTAGALMTTPCQVLRKTGVSDAWGGQTDTWAVLQETVCLVAPEQRAGGREQIALGRIEEQDRVIIRLPAGTDVDIKDRISAQGVTYEVVSLEAPRTIEISRIVRAVQVVT